MAASACELPSMSWEGLWESLIYSDDIKSKLLDYIYATVVFSDADVDCEWLTFHCPFSRWTFFFTATQSMSSRGTESYCSTVHPAQARHLYVEH